MMTRRQFAMSAAAFAVASGKIEGADAIRGNLRVGILSDIHVMRHDDKAARMLYKALRHFRDRHVDAVMITGDLTTTSMMVEFEAVAKVWNEVFPGDRLPDGEKVEKLFVSGNHDIDAWGKPGRKIGDVDKVMEQCMYFDTAAKWKRLYGEEYAPITCKVVKGYTFVLFNWVSLLAWHARNDEFFKQFKLENDPHTAKAWFNRHGKTLPKDKPFFFLQHRHPYGTCSSPYSIDQDRTTGDVLGRYPNCIAFSGHSHRSLLEERTIWQGKFTSVGCSALCGYAFTRGGRENGHCYDPAEKYNEMPCLDFMSCHQGMLMDVFDDRVVLERLDFAHEGVGKAKEDWIVPLGKDAPRPYTFAEREKNTPAPQFAADVKATVREIAAGRNRRGEKIPQIEVSFPPVNGLDGGVRAFDYRVSCVFAWDDVRNTVAEARVFSPNALQPAKYDVADVKCLFDRCRLPRGRELRMEVRPVNEWCREGNPIYSERFSL